MLRGAELSQSYMLSDSRLSAGDTERLEPGDTSVVLPEAGDIHLVRNAYDDRVSISIHAYGVNIGKQRRHLYDLASGQRKPFVSGYANG